MSIKVFKPQLKSDKSIDFDNKTELSIMIFLNIIVFLIFYYVEHVSIFITISIAIFFMISFHFYLNWAKKCHKAWDFDGYTTLEINTETTRICLDKSAKFYVNDINYVEVINNACPAPVFERVYSYSFVNVIMRFHLEDKSTIDFRVHRTDKLLEIINLLRILGANVWDSEVEAKHKDDIKIFWVDMAIIAVTVLFIIVAAIYNN